MIKQIKIILLNPFVSTMLISFASIALILFILCFICSGCVTQQQVDQIKTIIESNKQPVEIKQVVEKPIEVKPDQSNKERNEKENNQNVLPVTVNTEKESPKDIIHSIKNDLDFVSSFQKGSKDVKNWKVTTPLKVIINSKLNFQTTQNWQGKLVFEGKPLLSGNIWIIVNLDGKWISATFEFFRPGKNITKEKFIIFEQLQEHAGLPNVKPGDKVYFFVSGLTRAGSNVKERSEVVEVVL